MGYIETFGHGGDLLTAASVFPISASQFLDFSANINPLGPPARVLQRITEELSTINRYPDPIHRNFRKALANDLKIEPNSILTGNGAAECLALTIQGLSPKKLGVVYPCFSEYTQLAKTYGVTVLSCYGNSKNLFQPDPIELEQLFQKVDMVIIGHPNNPTGMSYSHKQLTEMAQWAEQYDTYLVIDEAFIDFIEHEKRNTLLPVLHTYPHVILIRSMTKIFAIPGIRLGYSIATPRLIQKMKEKQIPWSVNQIALLAGEVCLKESDYLIKTRQLISQERGYLLRSIREQFHWQVWDSDVNFLLIRLPACISARRLQYLLGKHGILIRDCSMYPGLTEHDFRIAVNTRTDHERLISTIAEVITSEGIRF
jgi:threonine-phosphate decarboxylase